MKYASRIQLQTMWCMVSGFFYFMLVPEGYNAMIYSKIQSNKKYSNFHKCTLKLLTETSVNL